MIVWIILLVWIITGALAYAMSFAYWQGKYDFSEWEDIDPGITRRNYREDFINSLLFGIMGPVSLVAMFFLTDRVKYGLKWK